MSRISQIAINVRLFLYFQRSHSKYPIGRDSEMEGPNGTIDHGSGRLSYHRGLYNEWDTLVNTPQQLQTDQALEYR